MTIFHRLASDWGKLTGFEVVGWRVARQRAGEPATNVGEEGKDGNAVPDPAEHDERLDKSEEDSHEACLDAPEDGPEELDYRKLPAGQLLCLGPDLLGEGDPPRREIGNIPKRVHLFCLQDGHGQGGQPGEGHPVVVREEVAVLTPSDCKA